MSLHCGLRDCIYAVNLNLRAASRGNGAEFEISKLFEAPYVLSVTGTRRYIGERRSSPIM
jgi:hypothetical protein